MEIREFYCIPIEFFWPAPKLRICTTSSPCVKALKEPSLHILYCYSRVTESSLSMLITADFVACTNRQIVGMDFDWTYIDFDCSPRTTLGCVRGKTTRLDINGHTERAAVMLGCTMSGYKFSEFVI